jgi:alanine racemase
MSPNSWPPTGFAEECLPTSDKGMEPPLIWAEIDLAAIAHNVRELRRITAPRARLMIAVKANAYGHGAVQVARAGLENGVDQLGVARIEEGIELRRAGIRAPILVFGYTPACLAPVLADYDLTASVFSLQGAVLLDAALNKDRRVAVHLKVDTGMGRMGLLPDQRRYIADGVNPGPGAVEEVLGIAALKNLRLEGLWTHFAVSDEADKSYTRQQLQIFGELIQSLKDNGLAISIHHAANSGAIIDMPESHLDMVRAGISVYGLYPSRQVDMKKIDLRPALTLKARITHVKQVPAGTRISYGGTWQSSRPTTIATVPVGYGDGYSRSLSNRWQMLVHGRRAPIVGRVCMDLTMIDVGHIDDVRVEDEVVLIGRQGDEVISADDVAAQLNTINYEVVTALMPRVPRVYPNVAQ